MTTLGDVAKKAKVSVMTVSRTINCPESVKPETREKVEYAIKELNYRPNMLAKSLVRGRSKTIGVIYSNVYNQAYLDMINGINNIAYNNNYSIMSTNVDNFQNAVKSFEMLIGNQIDGVIILPMEMAMSTRKDFDVSLMEMSDFYHYIEKTLPSLEVPLLTVSQKCKDIANLSFNYEKMAQITMEYLLGLGKKKITMISTQFHEGLWLEKETVYERMMKDAGLGQYIHIERQTGTVQGGHLAMDRICRELDRPEVVYCANDFLAIGAIQSAWSNGIRIPNDISVVGNDDISLSQMTFPRLTTVSLNAYLAGQMAAEMILKCINGEHVEDELMDHFMVERDSVKIN